VRARIIDKDGGSTEYTTTVVVNNVAPTAILGNNGPVNEGSPATITFSGQSDPSSTDTAAGFHYAYDCSGGSTTTATYSSGSITSATSSCTYNDGPADKTVAAWIFDKDGASTRYTTSVHVNNVPPTVTAPANQAADEGTSKSFTLGTFSDPGYDSPWAVDVNWGDSTTHATFNVTSAGAASSLAITAQSHTYADNGTYTVTVKVTDKDGGTDSKTFTVTVANGNPTVTPRRTRTRTRAPTRASLSAPSRPRRQRRPVGCPTSTGATRVHPRRSRWPLRAPSRPRATPTPTTAPTPSR
jgi:hypothetical protein